MKKILSLFIFIFLNLSPTIAYGKIVYIDINLILNKSEIGKSLNKYLQEINKKNIDSLKKLENDLKNKEEILISQKNILEKNEFEKKFNSLSIEVKDYRSEKKKLQDNLNNIKIENTQKILELLNPIITDFVEKNSISFVLPKKSIIVGQKKLDITDRIIILLNEQKKSLSF
tara:strand:+ start:1343 stop:1858 length:516 start_codon:yes stop_codon:yes gene_type:complete